MTGGGVSREACDLHTTDLGGNCGIEPTACGNVCTSFWCKSSNSEYLKRGESTDKATTELDEPLAYLHWAALFLVSPVFFGVPCLWRQIDCMRQLGSSLHDLSVREDANCLIGSVEVS